MVPVQATTNTMWNLCDRSLVLIFGNQARMYSNAIFSRKNSARRISTFNTTKQLSYDNYCRKSLKRNDNESNTGEARIPSTRGVGINFLSYACRSLFILWKVPVDCRGKSGRVPYCPNQTPANSRNLYYLLSLDHCRLLSSLPTSLIERLGCRSKHTWAST